MNERHHHVGQGPEGQAWHWVLYQDRLPSLHLPGQVDTMIPAVPAAPERHVLEALMMSHRAQGPAQRAQSWIGESVAGLERCARGGHSLRSKPIRALLSLSCHCERNGSDQPC